MKLAQSVRGDGPCQDCGSDNVIWFTDSALWNLVMGGPTSTDDPGGIVCIPCFVTRASAAGVGPIWKLVPQGTSDPVPLEEIDRNARAYGWEVGRGRSIDEVFESSPDNPFLDPGWRDGVPAEGTSASVPPARPPLCKRVGMHDCPAAGEWRNHDYISDQL